MSEWIPISKKLPKIGDTVLVCPWFATSKCDIRVSSFVSNPWCPEPYFEYDWSDNGEAWLDVKNVKAWMPLPEPYKEGE